MCYRQVMSEVGLREMRQNASDLVRRAEAGEKVTITVAGRPAAVLGPVTPRAWRRWDEVSDVFREPVDAEWEADRARLVSTPVPAVCEWLLGRGPMPAQAGMPGTVVPVAGAGERLRRIQRSGGRWSPLATN